MAVNFVLIDQKIIQIDTQIKIVKESEKYIRTEINSSVQETRGMSTMIVGLPSQWTISRLLRVSLENWAIMRSR